MEFRAILLNSLLTNPGALFNSHGVDWLEPKEYKF